MENFDFVFESGIIESKNIYDNNRRPINSQGGESTPVWQGLS